MRLLQLVFYIIIGASLAAHIPEAGAAASSKIIPKKEHSRKKMPTSTFDVWARIRSGMKISSPIAAVALDSTPVASTHAGAEKAAMKMRKDSGGMLRQSQSETPPPPRYTELGHSRLGQRNYTARGWKLLGAKTPSAADIDCTPSLSARGQKADTTESKYKIDLLKIRNRIKILKDQTNIGDTHPELHSGTVSRESKQATNGFNHSRLLTHSSQYNRETQPVKTAPSASPCKNTQLVANQQKLKGRVLDKQNALDGQASKQATINERIDKFVEAYTQNPDFLYRVAQRAHPYLYHIVNELSIYQLPLELALLPIVESAYQPTAESSKSAKGLWQFIPSTGRDYHLVQSHDYDERLDIPKSTQAAIRFLSGLNDHFNGDWLLALAAYNSGQTTVDNAISQNQEQGLATDFWSLNLPEETQNYVPRLLALSKIFARPASYGIKLPSIKNAPYFVKIKIDREFDVNYLAEKEISTIASLADLNHDQFRRLNPGYLGSTLSPKRSYAFLMPPDNADQFRQRLASIAQFMSEPVLSPKSLVLKEKPVARLDFYDPSLSLISDLVFGKPAHSPKFPAPFISLNVNDEQSILTGREKPLA